MTEMTLLLHDEEFKIVHFIEEKDEVEHFGQHCAALAHTLQSYTLRKMKVCDPPRYTRRQVC
jgi:hypothetical protein